jgi:hypothetical protein
MKTTLLLALSFPALLLADAVKTTSTASTAIRAVGSTDPAFPTPAPVDPAKLKEGVQITELGCMRAMVVFQKSSLDVEKLVTQRLSDSDFRVFGPYEVAGDLLPDATKCRDLGNDRKADLVVLTSVTSRELNKLGNFSIFEAEATVRIYSPVSSEIAIIHTSRVKGERHTNAADAERSAREKAAGLAAGEAVTKSLEKAHKILVHEAQIGGVHDRAHLDQILAHLKDSKAFYNVRQMAYDAKTKVAILELVGPPASESEWRTLIASIPMHTEVKEKLNVIYVKNEVIRQKYPGWVRTE